MEQFEEIRRDRAREGLSIRALAKRYGVHREAVRQALESAVPPAKRPPQGRPAPKLGELRAVIDGWLEADREARQAAAYGEADLAAAGRGVRRGGVRAAGVPVCARPAPPARRGWRGVRAAGQRRRRGGGGRLGTGEGAAARRAGRGASVRDAGVLLGREFVVAFEDQSQQAFLEARVAAFTWYGGVFDLVSYEYVPGHIFVVMYPNQLCYVAARMIRLVVMGVAGVVGLRSDT